MLKCAIGTISEWLEEESFPAFAITSSQEPGQTSLSVLLPGQDSSLWQITGLTCLFKGAENTYQ